MATINGTNVNGEALRGTVDDDVISGLGGADKIEGLAGADQINGGDGIDTSIYRNAATGVQVNLSTGMGTGGEAEGDVLISIENIDGTLFDDILIGNASANWLAGRFGSDLIEGGGGADLLDGGSSDGVDTVSYSGSSAGVVVDLLNATGRGGDAEGDEIYNFQNVVGSAHQDILIGDGFVNTLTGGDGNDILTGRGGNDTLIGGAGEDTAHFDVSRESATVSKVDGKLQVQSSEGTVTLEEIELLEFGFDKVSVQSLLPSISSTINVTTSLDVVDANDGVISLREAVTLANAEVGKVTIKLPESASSLASAVVLSNSTLGDLDITGNITIVGTGTNAFISNTMSNRVFDVQSGASLSLAGLTIDGNATSRAADDLLTAQNGGMLLNSGGTVLLDNVNVDNNVQFSNRPLLHDAAEKVVSFFAPSAGGALYNKAGRIDIINSSFTNNAAANGGAIYADGGTVNIVSTEFDANKVFDTAFMHLDFSNAKIGVVPIFAMYGRGEGTAIYSDPKSQINVVGNTSFTNNVVDASTPMVDRIEGLNFLFGKIINSVKTSEGRTEHIFDSGGTNSLIKGPVFLHPSIDITNKGNIEVLDGLSGLPYASALAASSPMSIDTAPRAFGVGAVQTLPEGFDLTLSNSDLALDDSFSILQSNGKITLQLAGHRIVLTGVGLSFGTDPKSPTPATGTITGLTILTNDGSAIVGTITGLSSDFMAVINNLNTPNADGSAKVLADAFSETSVQSGTSEGDTAIGTNDADVLNTLGGDDIITGKGGNDAIDGGPGTNTSKYAGEAKHFSVTISKGAATSVHDRKGTEGTDSLTSIEKLDFAGDKDVNLDILDGVVNVSSADLSAFIEMYIAYFNRAPDAEGLFYWGTRLSEGMSKNQIAESFYVQPETQALYTNPADTKGFVTAVYQNFLGRAPDIDGFNYWVRQLDDGIVSKPIFLLAIINGAKAASGSQTDVDYFTNKANIGAYYSVIKGMSNTDNGKAAMALYDGTAASVTAAKTAIDGYYAAAVDANTGELLINLVGVMDDPFAVA